jgi:predicted dehydrogenase
MAAMAAARLRVGLVGAGLVGQTEHAFYLWDDRDRFELVALADASQTVRTSVAARYGIEHTRERADELWDLGLDAIVCAAPDSYHHEVTTGALRAGLHVLCEKPLALSVADCDDIAQLAAAQDRVVQVGTMKRYDPSFLRMLELLPDSIEDVSFITAEVNDPDQAPFVDHLGLAIADDLPAGIGSENRARFQAAVDAALGRPASPGQVGAFLSYLSSVLHDLGLVHGILDHLGEPRCPALSDAAWWDDGRATSLAFGLRGGGRAQVMHLNLPGVPDYRERLTVYCRDRVLELTFPSPYLRHHPTRLVELRGDGGIGTLSTVHHVSYEEAFRNELRAFHRSITEGAPVTCDAIAGRDDVRTLIEAFQRATARD